MKGFKNNSKTETSLVAQWLRIHLGCKRQGFDRWSGAKIPHAWGQLSLGTTATEARVLWSTHDTTRVRVPQRKIPQDAAKILHAATKT